MLDFNIIRFDTIDSTNTYALENIRELPHNTIIIADTQTKGRGQRGRSWVSDSSENLYLSFVIKPDMPFKQLPIANFPQFFSVIVADVFASYGVLPQIKWPNDVLINEKKCAGILSEASFDGNIFNGLVVGVGINIGDNPADKLAEKQPASSLSAEIKQHVERDDFFTKLCDLYSLTSDSFFSGGFLSIKESYMKYFSHMGKKTAVTSGFRQIEGVVCGVSDSGEIVLRTDSGEIENIAMGEILWKRS
ncbi:MAG: biotin--[acetyl-CoA-carboxylase] ligase [Leptospirales bacterium]|nr:biotin--[acetyl-CoA-carboxylase] ligase [Leptospirales bacterium]